MIRHNIGYPTRQGPLMIWTLSIASVSFGGLTHTQEGQRKFEKNEEKTRPKSPKHETLIPGESTKFRIPPF